MKKNNNIPAEMQGKPDSLSPDYNMMLSHLKFLFGDQRHGYIEISRLTNSRYFKTSDLEEAAQCAYDWNKAGDNVYICAALIDPARIDINSTRRSCDADVLCNTALFVDIDDKAPAERAEEVWADD